MTKSTLLFLVFTLACFSIGVSCSDDCLGCTALVTVVERYIDTHEIPAEQFIEKELCNLLPKVLRLPCDKAVDKWGHELIALLEGGKNPDEACHHLGLCNGSPQCHLFPPTLNAEVKRDIVHKDDWINPIEWLKEAIANVTEKHRPLESFDRDGDYHAVIPTLRGSNWRGRDCNDRDDTIYPGRLDSSHPANIDHNCNGIHGSDSTGTPYEDAFCGQANNIGVVVMGDSAGAKFTIPPDYLNGSAINDDTYAHLIALLENEADWPMFSWGTGFEQDSTIPYSTTDSIYGRLRDLNLCNHRDYANLCVNGMRSTDMATHVPDMLHRNPNDTPALVLIALLGDDICNGHPDTVAHMTQPADFRRALGSIMLYLDTALPAGSHVAILGMLEHDLQWPMCFNRTHPLSDNVTYADFYSFLTCVGSNPCIGLLTSNETLRGVALQRAAELNAESQDLVKHASYNHFDIDYYQIPMRKGVDEWVAEGHDPIELFARVDGFHPSSIGHYLIAKNVWEWLEDVHGDWLGEANPHNDEIAHLFGDQGGY